MLKQAGLASQTSTLGLPSWVPDWSIDPRVNTMFNSKPPHIVPPSYAPFVMDSGRTLQVRGVFLGIIKTTSWPGFFPGLAMVDATETDAVFLAWCK